MAETISKEAWYDLAATDRQAAEQAFQEGRVEGLAPDVAAELEAGAAWNDVLTALRDTFDGQEAEVPDDRRPLPERQSDEPALPDSPMDWTRWKRLSSRDPRHAQRVWDAGLVDVPAFLQEELT